MNNRMQKRKSKANATQPTHSIVSRDRHGKGNKGRLCRQLGTICGWSGRRNEGVS
jgi:hypothetical protein